MSRIHLIAAFLLPLMLSIWWMFPSLGWLWLFVGFFMLGYVVYRQQWFFSLFVCLVFALPLSVELTLVNDHKWFFPSEILIAVSAIALVFYLKRKDLLSYDLWPIWWLLSFAPGVVFSEFPIMSMKFMIVNAAYVFVFYYGVQFFISKGNELRSFFDVYTLALFPVLFWALWQFAGYEFNSVTLPGIFKPFYNDHTIVGAVLALLAGYYMGVGSKSWGYLIIAAFIFAFTVLSGSRAAILSIGFMFVVYLALNVYWFRRMLPFTFVILGVLIYMQREVISSYVTQNTAGSREEAFVERVKSSTNLKTDASNIERLNRWSAAWNMFKERPHTGFGPGTYRYTYLSFQNERFENRLTVKNPENPPEGSGGTAHSELLLQLSEAGWLPFIFFLVMMGRWVFYGWRAAVNGHTAAKAGLLALSTYLFHMNVNNFLTTDAFAFLFWGSAATIMASVKQQDNE
ncbi:MAG: O-antigen ligase family protein [Cryomorphaceae bacterium]|nr:O-antigen ligase family protein [Cryomorphaceae bacterium]